MFVTKAKKLKYRYSFKFRSKVFVTPELSILITNYSTMQPNQIQPNRYCCENVEWWMDIFEFWASCHLYKISIRIQWTVRLTFCSRLLLCRHWFINVESIHCNESKFLNPHRHIPHQSLLISSELFAINLN